MAFVRVNIQFIELTENRSTSRATKQGAKIKRANIEREREKERERNETEIYRNIERERERERE